MIAELREIADAEADQGVFGTVPASWLAARRMGRATVARKRCADIYRAEWLSHLRRELESDVSAPVVSQNIQFDLSDLMSKNRRVSQKTASLIYSAGDFAGIYYQSRHGTDLVNWALFEPFELGDRSSSALHSADSAFQEALELLDLAFDPLS